MKHVHKSAFPIHVPDDGSHAEGFFDSGLSKREYFAAMAMQGILANHAFMEELKRGYGFDNEHTIETCFSEKAVIMADELLKQLEPKQ